MIRAWRFLWESRTEEHGHLSTSSLRFWMRRLSLERER